MVNNTEEEQIETLKRWWADYGKSIILGTVVGLVGIFGWRYYQNHQVETRAAGAEEFAYISEQLSTKGADSFSEVTEFVERNKGNNYGELAALLLAKSAVDAKDFKLAVQQLELALAGSKDAAISDTIRLRLARVLIAQEDFDSAQSYLNAVTNDAFLAERSEIQGDLYIAQADPSEAKAAYQAALEAGGLNNNPGLQLKLDNLAIATESSSEAG